MVVLQANTYAKCRFYYFKVWDDRDRGTLKVDMVPVYYYSTGKVRLYDKVRKVYKDPVGGDFALPWADCAVTNSSASSATLEVAVGEGVAATNSATAFSGDIDFVKSGDGEWYSAGLEIAGTYRHEAGTVCGITLVDGATLDLSALDSDFPLAENGLSFADDATISLVIGSRKPSDSTPFISWTSAPSNIEGLSFLRGDESLTYSVEIRDDGIYLLNRGFMLIFR